MVGVRQAAIALRCWQKRRELLALDSEFPKPVLTSVTSTTTLAVLLDIKADLGLRRLLSITVGAERGTYMEIDQFLCEKLGQ